MAIVILQPAQLKKMIRNDIYPSRTFLQADNPEEAGLIQIAINRLNVDYQPSTYEDQYGIAHQRFNFGDDENMEILVREINQLRLSTPPAQLSYELNRYSWVGTRRTSS
jgi:hypothetical protein